MTVENPSGTEDISFGFTFVDITITEVQAVIVGATSVTINPTHGASRSEATNAILNTPTAISNTTTGQNLTSFTDPTIPLDSWVVLKTTALNGTPTQLTVTLKYTID